MLSETYINGLKQGHFDRDIDIQNQQKEIESYKKTGESTEEVYKRALNKESQNLSQALLELQKKDKIIDEMLEEYEYNGKTNLNDFCNDEIRENRCIQDCRICIKQYFERKVNNAKN